MHACATTLSNDSSLHASERPTPAAAAAHSSLWLHGSREKHRSVSAFAVIHSPIERGVDKGRVQSGGVQAEADQKAHGAKLLEDAAAGEHAGWRGCF